MFVENNVENLNLHTPETLQNIELFFEKKIKRPFTVWKFIF